MKTRKVLKYITIFSLIILITPLVLYFYKFNEGLSSNDQAWSSFGSYFGGVSAALFSFASFISVLYGLIRNEDIRISENEEKHLLTLIDLLGRHKSFIHCRTAEEDLYSSQVVERYNNMLFNISIIDKNVMSSIIPPYIQLDSSVNVYCNLIIYIFEYIFKTSNVQKYMDLFLSQLSESDRTCVVAKKISFFEDQKGFMEKLMSEKQFITLKNMKTKADVEVNNFGKSFQ